MFDRMMTVTLNPAVDVTLWVDGLEPEKLNRIRRERVEAGGKGVNVSKLLTRLQVENRALVLCGEESQIRFERMLLADGVDAVLLPVPGSVRENFTFLLPDGTLVKLDRSGKNAREDTVIRLGAAVEEMCAGARRPLVVFAGSLPAGMDPQLVEELLLGLREQGVQVALDTLAFSARSLARMTPFAIKPNADEFDRICGKKHAGLSDIAASACALQARGVENVLVSLGARGLLAVRGERCVHVHPLEVPVRSTVAAGDSTFAGFLAGYVRGLPFEECARLAAACGTAAVTVDGTGVPDPADVARYQGALRVEPLR